MPYGIRPRARRRLRGPPGRFREAGWGRQAREQMVLDLTVEAATRMDTGSGTSKLFVASTCIL